MNWPLTALALARSPPYPLKYVIGHCLVRLHHLRIHPKFSCVRNGQGDLSLDLVMKLNSRHDRATLLSKGGPSG